VSFFSFSSMTMDLRSAPIMILSLARSNSSMVTGAPVGAGGEERCLVHEVREIGAGETGRAARDDRRPHVLCERELAHVDLEDLLPSAYVRQRYDDLPVEPAGPKQRRVEHVGPVGCRDYDHALVALETVHLDQELVQSLLALVVAAAEARHRDDVPPRRSRR
jgi:hypothetical protein